MVASAELPDAGEPVIAAKNSGPQDLRGIQLLQDLSAADLQRLAQACSWRDYKARQSIVKKNDSGGEMMFVVDGRVSVASYSITGKEIAFNEVGAGGFFGELAAIDGNHRSATVTALVPTRIAALPTGGLRKLVAEYPVVAWQLLGNLARVIRASNERLMDFATLSAQQRVCAELLRLAKPDPGNMNILSVYPLPTQATLASRVGATRETVARILSDLNRGGLVRRKGRILYIDSPERLTELLERLSE